MPSSGYRTRSGEVSLTSATGTDLRGLVEAILQPEGVAHGEHLPIVVEVRVDSHLVAPLLEATRPLLELALGIVAAAAARAIVETHERPVRGQLERLERLYLGAIADHE